MLPHQLITFRSQLTTFQSQLITLQSLTMFQSPSATTLQSLSTLTHTTSQRHTQHISQTTPLFLMSITPHHPMDIKNQSVIILLTHNSGTLTQFQPSTKTKNVSITQRLSRKVIQFTLLISVDTLITNQSLTLLLFPPIMCQSQLTPIMCQSQLTPIMCQSQFTPIMSQSQFITTNQNPIIPQFTIMSQSPTKNQNPGELSTLTSNQRGKINLKANMW